MSRLPDQLQRLTAALTALVRALEAGEADAVLAAEAPLATAAADLPALDASPSALATLDDEARARVRGLVDDARVSILTAMRLGATSAALLSALVVRDGYGRDGLASPGGRR